MKVRVDKLDILFSEYIRKRAVLNMNGCEHCGRPIRQSYKELQTSHFHGRRKRSVRYDPDNAYGSCFTCHIYLGENPYAHTEFFKHRLGSEKFELLNIRANTIVKLDKEEVEAHLRELLNDLHIGERG